MSCRQAGRRVLNLPEVHITMFAFLLSFPWEMFQSPFFHGLAEAPHWEAVQLCTAATLGDVGIMLALFWVVAGFGGGRHWVRRPKAGQVAGFTGLGLVVTVILEVLATHVWQRWSYSALMPVIPSIEVGLMPLLMWGVLPPFVIWFTQRQLMADSARGASVGIDAHTTEPFRMMRLALPVGLWCIAAAGDDVRAGLAHHDHGLG